jgi:3-oxoadipate enol-lactonase
MIATVRGVNLFYEQAGDGPPIVFIHGLGGTGNVWHAQRVGLSKYFRVITVDLPGSGRSDKSEREYSIEKWVDQIAGLSDAIGIDRLTLVGHSMTTVLAQKFAAKHSSRLNALVLCGPLTELAPPAQEAFTKRAQTVERDGMMAVVDGILTGALTAAAREGGNASLVGLYRELLLANDPIHYAGHIRALIAGSAKEDQAHINVPTLILVGDQDAVTPLALCRPIKDAIKDCKIRVIPGTAHLTMLERPTEFNAALVEFLAHVG